VNKDPLGFDGMADAEVKRRMKVRTSILCFECLVVKKWSVKTEMIDILELGSYFV
jgi:hypothetical protein